MIGFFINKIGLLQKKNRAKCSVTSNFDKLAKFNCRMLEKLSKVAEYANRAILFLLHSTVMNGYFVPNIPLETRREMGEVHNDFRTRNHCLFLSHLLFFLLSYRTFLFLALKVT